MGYKLDVNGQVQDQKRWKPLRGLCKAVFERTKLGRTLKESGYRPRIPLSEEDDETYIIK